MTLSLWTVYAYPKDFPNEFVARRFELDRPTADIVRGDSLAQVRARLALKGVSARLERDPNDDPTIIEVWL